ncbi:MAG: hypothetical protein ACK4V6_21220, partial [Microthrixaceae bacterium]
MGQGSNAGRWRRPATAVRRVALLAGIAVLSVACIPTETGEPTEVGDVEESPSAAAPAFPDDGDVSDELVAEGLVFDLTARPADASYWSLSAEEAECVAEAALAEVGGSRLLELGYRPGTPSAALSRLELTEVERAEVVAAVEGCVDMTEALASIFFGDGRIRSSVATCLAEGVVDRDQATPFATAVVFGEAVDPFTSDGALATVMLEQAAICVPDRAFEWSGVELPGEDPVIDSSAPAGIGGSPFPADQP